MQAQVLLPQELSLLQSLSLPLLPRPAFQPQLPSWQELSLQQALLPEHLPLRLPQAFLLLLVPQQAQLFQPFFPQQEYQHLLSPVLLLQALPSPSHLQAPHFSEPQVF